jgi:hypothetical protein
VRRRGTLLTRWTRLLPVLAAVAAAALPVPVRAQALDSAASLRARLWFHPLPPIAEGPYGPMGSRDFAALFARRSAWPRAMAHVGVVGMYAGWIASVSDQELQHTVAFLNAHGMGIEIEAPALQAPATCGSGVEGYVPFGQSLFEFTLAYLQRLKALGAQVLFVKVDEPFYFGSVSQDPRACRLPVPEVAVAVAQFAQLVGLIYPQAAIGDVEPIVATAYGPDLVTAMAQWHQVYQEVTGAPFPFFFADIDFSNPAWPQIVKAVEDDTRLHGTRFGIIYIGDPLDTSDAEWADKVVSRFRLYQGENGGRPDYVLFQSWQVHPTLCLPDSDPDTFTGVIDAYLAFGGVTAAADGGRP